MPNTKIGMSVEIEDQDKDAPPHVGEQVVQKKEADIATEAKLPPNVAGCRRERKSHE